MEEPQPKRPRRTLLAGLAAGVLALGAFGAGVAGANAGGARDRARPRRRLRPAATRRARPGSRSRFPREGRAARRRRRRPGGHRPGRLALTDGGRREAGAGPPTAAERKYGQALGAEDRAWRWTRSAGIWTYPGDRGWRQ